MWCIGRPSADRLDAELRRVATLPLSYAEFGRLGASGSSPPAGFARTDHRLEIDGDFVAARAALDRFATHSLPYLFVHPPDARVAVGANVLVAIGFGPAWSVNPCRVLSVESSADRHSYVYATLPGHVEHGEESFSITRLGDGRLLAETSAFWRPQQAIVRLGLPIARRVAEKAKRDYLLALKEALRARRS